MAKKQNEKTVKEEILTVLARARVKDLYVGRIAYRTGQSRDTIRRALRTMSKEVSFDESEDTASLTKQGREAAESLVPKAQPRKPAGRQRRYPVVSSSAESLTVGYLKRRNILAYPAPPNNRGYDLICVHPDPTKAKRVIRVQVKSRYSADSDKSILLGRTLGAFDYLVAVFLNIGYFYGGRREKGEALKPEFYTFPKAWVESHHRWEKWGLKLRLRQLRVEAYRDEKGFERIAKALRIPPPRE